MNAADRTRVTVDIYGNQFKLTGHNNPEYIKRIAAFVDENLHKLAKGYPRLDLPKLAMLASVQMAEDVFRLRVENERMHETEERRKAAVAELEQAKLVLDALQDELDSERRKAEQELQAEREHARQELERTSAGLQGRMEAAVREAEAKLAQAEADAQAELTRMRSELEEQQLQEMLAAQAELDRAQAAHEASREAAQADRARLVAEQGAQREAAEAELARVREELELERELERESALEEMERLSAMLQGRMEQALRDSEAKLAQARLAAAEELARAREALEAELLQARNELAEEQVRHAGTARDGQAALELARLEAAQRSDAEREAAAAEVAAVRESLEAELKGLRVRSSASLNSSDWNWSRNAKAGCSRRWRRKKRLSKRSVLPRLNGWLSWKPQRLSMPACLKKLRRSRRANARRRRWIGRKRGRLPRPSWHGCARSWKHAWRSSVWSWSRNGSARIWRPRPRRKRCWRWKRELQASSRRLMRNAQRRLRKPPRCAFRSAKRPKPS